MRLKVIYTAILLMTLQGLSLAQSGGKFGVRSGLNYSTLLGAKEQGEDLDFNTGIHFGINYTYYFIPKIGVRGEVLYTQKGWKQRFQSDDSYAYVYRRDNGTDLIESGSMDFNLEVTNSYISVPITMHYQIAKKWEVYGGFSVDFLVGSSGSGTQKFSNENSELYEVGKHEIIFTQSLDYRYFDDRVEKMRSFNTLVSSPLMYIGGETVPIPRIIGAYHHLLTTEKEFPFNKVDANIIVGTSFFINSGFYVGLRGEFGLTDITRKSADRSLQTLTVDRSYVFRDDSDQSLSLVATFGFRF